MSGFTKLVPEIIQSSIWNEPSDVRVVWITLLAVKDAEGYVRGDARTVARLANVPIEAAELALARFQEPDPSSHTPDHEGRRIAPAPGGWVVLNHELYRVRDANAEHAAYVRAWRAERAKKGDCDTSVMKCDSHVNHPSASASVSASASGDRGAGEGSEQPPPPEPPPTTPRKPSPPADQDAEWLATIKATYAPLGIDVDAQLAKARGWLLTPKGRGRKMTRQFLVNWLNRADRTITAGGGPIFPAKDPRTVPGTSIDPKDW